MNDPTESISNAIRMSMSRLAIFLNKISKGRIKPSHITVLSLIGHFPAGWALWQGKPVLAAILIAFFGLMDSLDGALARTQKSASKFGMFFDAVTDRFKEVIIYSALAVYVFYYEENIALWVIPAVAGTSLLVSYVKAKGEMAVSSSTHDKQALNRAFSQGYARYEIRMALLIAGLLSGLLPSLLNLIIALNLITIAMRFTEIGSLLQQEDKKAKDNAKS